MQQMHSKLHSVRVENGFTSVLLLLLLRKVFTLDDDDDVGRFPVLKLLAFCKIYFILIQFCKMFKCHVNQSIRPPQSISVNNFV